MYKPTTPGALIGYRKDGTEIRLAGGGSPDHDGVVVTSTGTPPAGESAPPAGESAPAAGEGAPAGEAAGQATPPAPATPVGPPTPTPAAPVPAPPPAAQPPAAPAAEAPPAGEDGDDLAKLPPDKLADMVRKLREENAKDRTAAKAKAAEEAEKALAEKIGRQFGFIKDEEKAPTAEELTEKLTSAQQEAASHAAQLRNLQVENAAAKAARTHRADADALLDSLAFTSKLQGLDPTDAGFAGALDALVKQEVEANPKKYRLDGPAPSASSGDFSGGSGDKPPTRDGIDDFRKARRERSGVDI